VVPIKAADDAGRRRHPLLNVALRRNSTLRLPAPDPVLKGVLPVKEPEKTNMVIFRELEDIYADRVRGRERRPSA
jgi:isocitrate dehydrogenase